MKLSIGRHGLRIIPEGDRFLDLDERDTAYIEEVLGLRNEGDAVRLVRRNAYKLSCIAYLETEKEASRESLKLDVRDFHRVYGTDER